MLKTKRIGLIVTEEEKDWIIQLAKLEGGLSQASLIRRLIHQAAHRQSLFNPTIPSEIAHEKENRQVLMECPDLGRLDRVTLDKSNLKYLEVNLWKQLFVKSQLLPWTYTKTMTSAIG